MKKKKWSLKKSFMCEREKEREQGHKIKSNKERRRLVTMNN